MSLRAGTLIEQPGGYRAFIPKSLPPDPPILYDEQMQILLSNADRALARLDGVGAVLPNLHLFQAMYLKKEAILSSQIEATQASLEGILEFEANLIPKDDINEIREVINYIKALDYGIARLKWLPLSLRLIKEIHKILIEGTKGGGGTPGEFRTSQNWIGSPGTSSSDAIFIPTSPDMILPSMEDLEKFLFEHQPIPHLVKIALIHAQFRIIHPFLDGNGRVGRLLISFYLFWKGLLSTPLLYLSSYFNKHRTEYHDLLMSIRTDGAWEGWIKFFLKGISEVSIEATNTAREIIKIREDLIDKLFRKSLSSIYAVKLIDLLFETPLIDGKTVGNKLNVSKESANELVRKFEDFGILSEISGKQRYKKYLFKDYVEVIARGTRI